MRAIIGIDIGGTSTKVGSTDGKGNVINKSSFVTSGSKNHFMEDLRSSIDKVMADTSPDCILDGIGVGAPSVNYRNGEIKSSANLGWKGSLNIKQYLSDLYQVPVRVTNDANLPAVGEMVYGAAQSMRDFITVSLGTGLGCGIVANGKLVEGHNSMAGEIGHSTVYLKGRQCGCGRKGCLETYVSATGIKRTVYKLLADSNGSNSKLAKISFEQLSAKDITEAAKNNDPIAIEAFNYTGKIFALKLSEFLTFTDPEAIFLVGGLSNAEDLLFDPVRKYLEKYRLSHFANSIKLLPSRLPVDHVTILGASALLHNIHTKDKIEDTF